MTAQYADANLSRGPREPVKNISDSKVAALKNSHVDGAARKQHCIVKL
jgi:hypothetical protein